MLVTVLIPCRDDEQDLPRLMEDLATLQGLLAPEHFPELLLVDGGSLDGTVPLAIAWCERSLVPARLIALDKPSDFAEIVSEALPFIAGDIVLVLDPAFACPATELVRLVRALSADIGLALPSLRSVPSGCVPRLLQRASRQILRWRRAAPFPDEACISAGPRAWRKPAFAASLAGTTNAGRGVMSVRALLNGVSCHAVPLALTTRTSPLAPRLREALSLLRRALGARAQ